MKVIVDGMKNLERATTFAAKCDDSAVWSQVIMKRSRLPYMGIMYGNLPAPCHNMARGARSQLARAQLDAGMVGEAIDTYAKANDVTAFAEVINAAQRENAYEALVTYLSMARKVAKNDTIDTELVYAYCKTVRARPRALAFPVVNRFCMALLCGRAGRITANNGVFRPGQNKLIDLEQFIVTGGRNVVLHGHFLSL